MAIFVVSKWLDKLGLAALRNHTKVFRQSFYGGFYGLLYFDYTPTPVSYLKLCGNSNG